MSLSNIPDLTASVSVPRIAGIEYPFGRILGNPGDNDGQREVLVFTFSALEEIKTPGTIIHLPFEWPEKASDTRMEPPQPPPIAGYLLRHPWHLPKLFSRTIP